MKALKSGSVKQVDDAYDVGIGTQFSAETNKRDEDEEMYVFTTFTLHYTFLFSLLALPQFLYCTG